MLSYDWQYRQNLMAVSYYDKQIIPPLVIVHPSHRLPGLSLWSAYPSTYFKTPLNLVFHACLYLNIALADMR